MTAGLRPATARGSDAKVVPAQYLLPVLAATFVVVASFVFVNLVFVLMDLPSTLTILRRWLAGDASYDSWAAMRTAHQWLQELHPGTVYQEIFFNRQNKFQYPLTSLLPFVALDHLGIGTQDDPLNRINAVLHLAGALATAAASTLMMRRLLGRIDVAAAFVASTFGAVTFVTFYPTMRAFELGQVQVWITMIFCAACVAWLLDRKHLVGALIGVICLIKPQFSLFLVWALVRREWALVAGWVVVVVPGVSVSLALFGLANHWDYLSVLQFLSERGEAYYANQSINGLLNRFLGNGVSYPFQPHQFPPYHFAVYVGTMATSLLIAAVAILYRPKNGFFDFLIAGLSFTLASPIAWEHHYGILPIYFVALFFTILSLPSGGRRRWLLMALAAAFVVGGNFYSVVRPLGPGPVSLAQSYLLFVVATILWLLYRLRERGPWDNIRADVSP